MDAEPLLSGQPRPPAAQLPATVSELNNLLHIIAGTTDLIGNIWHESPAADRYLEMLRHSVTRAASVTEQLVAHATNRDPKITVHPAARDRMFPQRVENIESIRPTEPAKLRILVVDDEPLALELARAHLEAEGFDVITAGNGFEGLKELTASPRAFALVVLDLTMPIMDGEETFERIRGINPDLPVLLNTGFALGEKVERMVAGGLSGLITKPASPAEYVAKVHAVIAGARHGTVSA